MFNDTQNLTIALLLVAAAALGAILIGTLADEPAYADASVRQGRYIAVTGAWSNDIDLLYVLDVPNQKLNAYFLQQNDPIPTLADTVELKQVFR